MMPPSPPPDRPGRAGAALVAAGLYAGIVFALGFVFGTVRTLLMAQYPGIDRLTAVALEIPVMLAASWLICGAVLRRTGGPATTGGRLVMGAVALILLLAAETALGLVLTGQSLAAQLADYREAGNQLGLAGQALFGLIPWARGILAAPEGPPSGPSAPAAQ